MISVLQATAEIFADKLNEQIKNQYVRQDVLNLVNNRIVISSDTLDNSPFICVDHPDDSPTGESLLGALGLINGLLSPIELQMMIDDDGSLIGFRVVRGEVKG